MIDDASSARLEGPALVPAGIDGAPAPPSTEGALPRFRRALGVTFAVHVVTALVAAIAALSVSRALVAAAGPQPFFAEAFTRGAPIAPETLATFGEHALGPLLLGWLGVLALQTIVGLPISLLWLGAMAGDARAPSSPRPASPRSFRRLLRQVLRAVGASVVLLVPLVVVAGLTIALPILWHLAFEEEIDPRVRDFGVLFALLPGMAATARWASWSDHTRAAVSLDASVGASLRVGFRAGGTGEYVVVTLVALVLFGLGVVSSGLAMGLVLAQLTALARTFVRAFWLARAQSRVARAIAAE